MFRITATGAVGVLVMGMAGCSQAPVQTSQLGGEFITIDQAEFAVFAEDGVATAVHVGTSGSGNLVAARQAIEYATGCPVVAKTMTSDQKTVEARLNCKTASQRRPKRGLEPVQRPRFGADGSQTAR